MKAGNEKKYLEKYWKETDRRLEAFLHGHDQVDLHQFRVNVKKLKSALLLLQGPARKSLIKRFRPVRKIFRKAGEIRDVHVHQQLARRYHLENTPAGEAEQERLAELTEDFCAHAGRYRKNLGKARKKINKAVHPLHSKEVLLFYTRHLQEIAAFLARPVFDEQLHACRKKIKYLLHNYKLASQAGKHHLPPLQLPYLKQLQALIGEWHDNMLSIDLFSRPGHNNPGVADRIRQQNAALQSRILAEVKDFGEKAGTSGEDPGKKITEE